MQSVHRFFTYVLSHPIAVWLRHIYALLGLYLQPLGLLAIRLWLADIFFSAGRARIVNWQSQEFLFSQIHPVPGIPAFIAAPVTTISELTLAVLFAFGLLGRLSGIGLLVMISVIQFVVGQTEAGLENNIANPIHYYWLALCAVVVILGPGKLSVDALIMRLYWPHKKVT